MPGDNNKDDKNKQDDQVIDVTDDTLSTGGPHPASGMYQYMQEFLDDGDKTYKDNSDDNDNNDDDKGDKLIFEKLTEEDTSKFNKLLEKDKLNEEELKEFDFSDEEITKIKDKYSDKFKVVSNDFDTNLEEMQKEDLIKEIKKNQRLVSERNQKIKDLENNASKPTVTDEKLRAFINDIKSDLKGGWKKHAKDFDLPDLSLIQASNSNGNLEDRLYQWQQSELRSEIEKEFDLEKGEFEVVKEDLYEPRTPSYRWRTKTEAKEKELNREIENQVSVERQRLAKIQQQQADEIKWFAENYTDKDITKAQAVVQQMNEVPQKIAKGELTPDKHPFALKNLLLGFKHDELVTKAVNDAVAKITKQFNDKGVYLESNKELPTDITNVKAPKSGKSKVSFDKSNLEKSPMLRNLNEILNL